MGENMQIIYLIRDLYLEYTKTAYSSIIKTYNPLKIGKGFEQTFLQRRWIKSQWEYDKMLNIINNKETQIKITMRHH